MTNLLSYAVIEKRDQEGKLIRLIKLTIILLIIVCVFDPYNKLLNIKYQIFCLAGVLFLLKLFLNRAEF